MGILFVVNPAAGKGRSKKIIPIIEDAMLKNGYKFKIVETSKPRDGVYLTYNGIMEGFDTVVAVGGDGTINEVTQGIIKAGKGRLGIIPGGTGNDLIRTLNIDNDPKKALEIILKGNSKKINLGRVNNNIFINIASIGFDSEIAKNTEKIKSMIKGKFAYTFGLLKTLITYKNKKIKITTDNFQMEAKILLLAIANGKYYGGGMKISPMSNIADDYLDICIIKDISKAKLLLLFPSVFKGEHIKYSKYVKFIKAKKIEIESYDEIYVNVDGEVFNDRGRICFSIDENTIEVIVG